MEEKRMKTFYTFMKKIVWNYLLWEISLYNKDKGIIIRTVKTSHRGRKKQTSETGEPRNKDSISNQ